MNARVLSTVLVSVMGVTVPEAAAQSDAQSGPLQITGIAVSADAKDQDDWQRQYDTARATKNSGKKKMLVGIGIGAAAFVVANLAASDCRDDRLNVTRALQGRIETCEGNLSTITIAGIGSAGGGALFIWGLVQYMDGNGDMRALESQRPKPTAISTALTMALSERSELRVTVGRRSAASIGLTW